MSKGTETYQQITAIILENVKPVMKEWAEKTTTWALNQWEELLKLQTEKEEIKKQALIAKGTYTKRSFIFVPLYEICNEVGISKTLLDKIIHIWIE